MNRTIQSPAHQNTFRRALIALAAGGCLLVSGVALQASQTLQNPGFESGYGGWSVYSGAAWNYYIKSDYVHSGNSSAGIVGPYSSAQNYTIVQQRAQSAPGSTYTAGGWGLTPRMNPPDGSGLRPLENGAQAWLEVSFRDAANAQIALYRSAAMDANTPVDTWIYLAVTNQYNPTTYAFLGTVTSMVAPAGTVAVQYQIVHYQPNYDNGYSYWDDLVLDQTAGPVPPVIGDLSPDGSALFNIAATHFTFTASSTTTDIDPSGIHVIANGTDVSSLLAIDGTARNRTVSLALKSNLVYSISITVTDTVNFSSSSSLIFDTFSPDYYVWEAEDYNHDSGLFVDNPQTNAYSGLPGSADIDFHETTGEGNHFYRTADTMATDSANGDVARAKYKGTGFSDYKVGWFNDGEWVNFTRTFPSGKWNIYARVDGGNGAAKVDLSSVVGATGPDQTATLLGSFSFVGRGWSVYDWAPLKDTAGNLVAVSLDGVSTLRATTHGGADLNFFMLVPAVLDLPVISNVSPDGTFLFQPGNTFTFTASSPSATIPTNGVTLSINGVDVTSQLVITGTSLSKSVSYVGLVTNQTYTAVISVTDANGDFANRTVYFDTFAPSFTWEAEDWDYQGGQFVSSWSPCAYANLSGIEGTDYHDSNNSGNHPYRPSDAMSADTAGDALRTVFAGTNDYSVGYFVTGEWMNYTRNYPAGTYNVYGRFAAGGEAGTMSLSIVTNGTAGTLGTFNIANTGGWGTYAYVPLRDAFGSLVQLTISGSSATTFRVTRTGGADANVNFFMLVPPRTDLPTISQVYPDGTLELQATNSFRFTAGNPVVPIDRTNITLTLNGTDVTPALSISGSPNNWNVSTPIQLNSGRYTAVIRVQDADKNVATATIYFDTFNPTNFTWEAEDYDFGGGSYIDDPAPTSATAANSYFGQDSTFDVDYHYESVDPATPYQNYFRYSLGIDVCGDNPPLARYVTARLTDPTIQDYNLAYWTSNSWANYTHTYPAGTYNVYGRLASGTGGSVQMDQITATATNHLGQFNIPNWGWGVYSWWPLVDANGKTVTVTLGGVSTLRATTDGSANANRFMLATPLAAVTAPQITATASGGSASLSFPDANRPGVPGVGQEQSDGRQLVVIGDRVGQ